MTSTAVQAVPTEQAIKQAIIALIKENNAEFKQLLADALTRPTPSVAKKEQKKVVHQANQNGSSVPKPRIPYSEMPFWKANPDLKPRVLEEGEGVLSAHFFDALKTAQESFKDVSDEDWEKWLEQLKD